MSVFSTLPGYSHLQTLVPEPVEPRRQARTTVQNTQDDAASKPAPETRLVHDRAVARYRQARREITDLISAFACHIAAGTTPTGPHLALMSAQVVATIRVEHRTALQRFGCAQRSGPKRLPEVERLQLYPSAEGPGAYHFVATVTPGPCYLAGSARQISVQHKPRWSISTVRFVA